MLGHSGPITALAFHPGGETLYSGSEDFTVRYWRVHDAQAVATLTAVRATTFRIAVTPDGSSIASAHSDASIRLQRASDGTPIRALKGHTKAVRGVAFSPDGHFLALRVPRRHGAPLASAIAPPLVPDTGHMCTVAGAVAIAIACGRRSIPTHVRANSGGHTAA